MNQNNSVLQDVIQAKKRIKDVVVRNKKVLISTEIIKNKKEFKELFRIWNT